MSFIVYIGLNAIVIYLFTKIEKTLHILEIMMYWMVGSYLVQNFSALCSMNFKTLIVPDILTNEFAHVLNRLVLYPVLIVTFLDIYSTLLTFSRKLPLFVVFVLFFVGLEWVGDWLRVLIHVHWRLWWSFAFWTATLMVSIGFMKLFRRILYKRV